MFAKTYFFSISEGLKIFKQLVLRFTLVFVYALFRNKDCSFYLICGSNSTQDATNVLNVVH